GCSALTSVTIPNSVTTIGGEAFSGCKALTSVTISNSVKTIGVLAFYNCSALTSVNIPNSITEIGGSAFEDCSSLTSVNIPNSVTTIENWAFRGCSALTSVNIPNSVTTIGWYAFSECTNLQKVNIGNSVKTIGEFAFNKCTNITQISSEAVVPPTCESGVFTDINKSKCKLIVPKNSLDAYKQAYQWEDFSLIEGSTTGITNTVYNKAGLADVYTIDGTKRLSKASTDEINALPKGVYIVNGKKIIIK
ncbi:MAG: leucine-rich repeat domain-containing protein, partial [Prevotella sp.]|nr:leucine-rich repeat domain-containing protein [Prevotella sp.]